MDILAARKKAAEQARAGRKAEPETGPAESGPAVEDASKKEEAVVPQAPLDNAAPPEIAPIIPEEPASEAVVSSELPAEKAPVREIEMLSFRLGQEEYALMIDDVKEVLKNRDLTPVPNAPDYIPGVTALRGLILPVVDPCRRLGIPGGVRDEKSRILVVSLDSEDVGVIVDRIAGVVKIDPEIIRPVPETIEHGAEFLQGIARKDDKLYILLDKEKALGG